MDNFREMALTDNVPEWGWWQWPNLLSLDAPLVALIWQESLARAAGVPLLARARVTLFLAVWAVYLADRLLDSRRPASPTEPARHRFTRGHREMLTALLGIVLTGGAVAAVELRASVRTDGLLLGLAVLLYLTAVHALKLRGLPKEMLVAVLFTAGTALAPWARTDQQIGLLAPVVSMVVLCWLNLAGIEARESPEASASTRWGTRHMRPLALAAGLMSGNAGIAASALGLVAWRSALPRLSLEASRVLVDVPLLLPALFWVAA